MLIYRHSISFNNTGWYEKMTTSEKLKMYKKKKGTNNALIAKKLDVSVDSVKNWSSGRFKPGSLNLRKLDHLFLLEGIR